MKKGVLRKTNYFVRRDLLLKWMLQEREQNVEA